MTLADHAEADSVGNPDVHRLLRAHGGAIRDGGAPLWVQVKNALADTIRSGALSPDARLPSEQALCGIFGVSRPVVREALEALVNEGCLVKVPRRGVFIARPRDNTDFLTSNVSVFDDMTAKGHAVTTRTFECRRAEPSPREREMLGLPAGSDVVRIGRVYIIDNRPITMTRISIAGYKALGLENAIAENRSVFGLLRERYGLTAIRAERWFTALMPSPEQAAALQISTTTPVIGIESVAYSADGSGLEYYDAIYNPQVARMHLAVSAGGSAATEPTFNL